MPVCEFVHKSAFARESQRCQTTRSRKLLSDAWCGFWEPNLGFSGRVASVFNPPSHLHGPNGSLRFKI